MFQSKRIKDRKSTRLNSSHTEIYTLSLHDALPISYPSPGYYGYSLSPCKNRSVSTQPTQILNVPKQAYQRSEEHTSELQSHRDLHSFPTRRSSDLLPISGILWL